MRPRVGAGVTTATRLGELPCYTPACGWEPGMETSAPAEVWRIGRQVRLVCQRCGGCWGLSASDQERMVEKKAAEPPRCTNYRPDHNGECQNCDEPASEHGPDTAPRGDALDDH